MRFIAEQIAICPKDPAAARALLTALGAIQWSDDKVTAHGLVHGEQSTNVANLAFNYELISGKEFEILDYESGPNWMEGIVGVSHFGVHCTPGELLQWRAFFAERGIRVAQEVLTLKHTNPAIAGKRRYQYVIFDTRAVLGVDLKFIIRIGG